ncbi:MAG: signal peptidase I [Actinomycetota bacterium]|nr:signal peptidase I [Actinomycetota bacterium]
MTTTNEPDLEAGDGQGLLPGPLKSLIEWVVVLVVAVAVALFFRAFLLQSFWIKSGSMETTLLIRDRVMVNRLSYRFGEPERGQILVFESVDPNAAASGEQDLIKRVIGVGGDTIEGRDGEVFVNGSAIDEPYLDEGQYTNDFGPVVIEPDHLWLMGDNRIRSSDSRYFGQVPVDNVIGRAFLLYWPLGRAGTP